VALLCSAFTTAVERDRIVLPLLMIAFNKVTELSLNSNLWQPPSASEQLKTRLQKTKHQVALHGCKRFSPSDPQPTL